MTEYGFLENTDFVGMPPKCNTPGGIQNITDHALTLDKAKEISMIQRTKKERRLVNILSKLKIKRLKEKIKTVLCR